MKPYNMSAGDTAKALCSLAHTRASNDSIGFVMRYDRTKKILPYGKLLPFTKFVTDSE
jgi:hypothetical protein